VKLAAACLLSKQPRLIATVAFASGRENCCVIFNAQEPARGEREAQRIFHTQLLALLERNDQRDLLFAQLRFISHAQAYPRHLLPNRGAEQRASQRKPSPLAGIRRQDDQDTLAQPIPRRPTRPRVESRQPLSTSSLFSASPLDLVADLVGERFRHERRAVNRRMRLDQVERPHESQELGVRDGCPAID